MYYLTDICFMCLKNNIKLQSVFIQDNDGIVFNEKLRCCFPEIINSTPDAHKLACSECLEKLRILYDFRQSGIHSNTVVSNYLDKLQYENKTRQQPSVVLATRKRRRKVSLTDNFSEIKVENVGNSFKMKIKNLNLNSTKEEQVNTFDNSFQTTANGNVLLTKYSCATEEKHLETKNVEKVVPVTETGTTIYVKQESQFSEDDSTTNSLDKEFKDSKDTETIYIKQEPQFSEDNSTTTSYLDKEAEDSEGNNSSNEDDPNFEMSEEGASRPNDYNKQKVNAILNTLKPSYVSDDSVKFCNTCQDLLFKDLVNINVHLYTHIQSSNCSRCEDSLEEINKFQRHMFNHCETIFEILDKGEHGEKFSCALCDQQFDEFSNLKKHISDKHIRSLKCVVCSKAFTHKPNLLRHILVTHCQVKLYKCKICSTRFTCKEAIKEHVFYQHYNGKVCVCKYCYQTFRNPKSLREHISKHHGEVERLEEDSSKKADAVESLSCAVCHQQFNNVGNLKKHLYGDHVNSLECEICFKTFARRVGTVRHILETHCRVKLYNCVICVRKFTCKKNCDKHMSKMHNNDNAGAVIKQINKVTATENHEDFSCGICGIQFSDFESSKKHIYDEHMPSLDCIICSASYPRRIVLYHHILEKHCGVKVFKCIICSIQFLGKESFKNHMIHEHNGGETIIETENKVTLLNGEKVTCTICSKEFDVFESLRRHIYDKHFTGLDCVVCSKTCTRRTVLNRHILEKHCQIKIINCKICPQRFACKESFENHMKQKHPSDKFGAITELDNKIGAVILENGKKVTCTICNKQFDVFETLRRHVYDKHITGLECIVCSNSYCTRVDLNRHILKIHCNLRIFNCIICSIKFISKESFKNHMIHKHNDGKTITKLENKIPVTLTNGEKFTCAICNNQFDVFEILKRHIYDEHMTSLDCVVCSNTFCWRGDLNRHILEKHCRIKIFNCKLCPQRFAGKDSFKDHMNQQHSSDKEQDIVGEVTEVEKKAGSVTEPEEIFIKEEPYYSDEYYSSDEEYEADNYEIEKDFSNFAMTEESNSYTSNSYDLEEFIGSSIISKTTATTEASYCEPSAPVDQSDVCAICHKMFLYLSNISEHLNAHMQESSCSMCKDSAEKISRLQRHMLTPCGNTNISHDSANTTNTRTNDKVTCVVCQQKFKFNILKKHLYTHITNLACVVCNRTFTKRQNLLRHLLHHCNLKPLQCEVCSKTFSVKSGLKYHVENAHSAEVIACQYCKTEFKNFRSLQRHVLNYHPNYTYTCEICKRNFPFKNELEKHAKLHIFSQ